MEGEKTLESSIAEAIERELADLPDPDRRLSTEAQTSAIEETLAQRRTELDAIGAAVLGDEPVTGTLGLDLTGAEQQRVSISLQSAISTAVKRNLSVQIARLQPAISAADLVAAEAVFDAVFFSSAEFTKTDRPTTVPVLGGIPLGTPIRANDAWRFETGLRRQLTSGGQITVSTELANSRNRTPGFGLSPDPAYLASARLALTQPLLRGFGRDVNLSTIRLAQNTEQHFIEELRLSLLDIVEETESAYWSLVTAWRELAIQEWLVEVGVQVRDVMDLRRDFDTRTAQYADAVARVEQRRADLIRVRRRVRAASDSLKTLINDALLTIGSEAVLLPSDPLVEAPVTYSLREAILTAAQNRPEIKQSILGIDDASIRQTVADNRRLPLLDLSAQLAYFGLDGTAGDSYDDLGGGNFIEYVVGLQFELPVGNREARAGYRRARLQRSAAVIAYQRVVQNVVLDVKNALRDVVANYELIQATRSFRVAQAENLRALRVEEETLAGLTPEFLNLKFQRQETLANAQQQEITALANYDRSIAALYRSMGIGLRMNRIQIEVVDEPYDSEITE